MLTLLGLQMLTQLQNLDLPGFLDQNLGALPCTPSVFLTGHHPASHIVLKPRQVYDLVTGTMCTGFCFSLLSWLCSWVYWYNIECELSRLYILSFFLPAPVRWSSLQLFGRITWGCPPHLQLNNWNLESNLFEISWMGNAGEMSHLPCLLPRHSWV